MANLSQWRFIQVTGAAAAKPTPVPTMDKLLMDLERVGLTLMWQNKREPNPHVLNYLDIMATSFV